MISKWVECHVFRPDLYRCNGVICLPQHLWKDWIFLQISSSQCLARRTIISKWWSCGHSMLSLCYTLTLKLRPIDNLEGQINVCSKYRYCCLRLYNSCIWVNNEFRHIVVIIVESIEYWNTLFDNDTAFTATKKIL